MVISSSSAGSGYHFFWRKRPPRRVAGAEYGLLSGTLFAFATALGFALALVLFAGIREQLALNKVPKAMQGTPIALLTAGLLAMTFMGFSGVVG